MWKEGFRDIRLRQPMPLSVDIGNEGGCGPSSGDEEKPIRSVQPPRSFPTIYALIVTSVLAALLGAVYGLDQWLPSSLTLEDLQLYPDRFNSERAHLDLVNLTSFGVRTAGSYKNDIETVNWLQKELNKIANTLHHSKKVEIDVQKTSGSFHLGFKFGVTSCYDDLTNVVVRLRNVQSNSTSALLINCHFDSVPLSPGASDDAISCAVMMEIMRILSRQSAPLTHSIIFLFNGAEENALQTAHGFITQHKWAKSAKAFVNLEAAGAGGRQILFQNAIHHPWLLQAYANSAPHPHGFVIAEDIFQSGIIPSDTDFRIFRDFGNIPGLDFAFYRNGYAYHTKYDNLDQISMEVIQCTGDNTLALVTEIANSPYLGALHDHTGNKTVFWDLFGFTMVNYSQTTGAVIGLSSILLSVYTTVSTLLHLGPGMQRKELCVQGLKALVGPFVGWVMAFMWCGFVAMCLDFVMSTMSWYSQPLLLMPLYSAPTFLFATLGLYLQYRITRMSPLCGEVRVQLYSLGVQLIWTVLLMTLTLFGSRSAYLLQMLVFFPSIASFSVLWFARPGYKIGTWLWLELSALVFPTAVAFYHVISFIGLFVPVMGRVGPNINSELVMALCVCFLTLLCTSYLAPMVLLLRQPKRVLQVFALVHILTVAFVMSPIIFPYAGDSLSPTPQRVYVLDVHRESFNYEQKKISNDSGLWFLNMDRNSPYALYRAIPALGNARSVAEDCEDNLACGLPLYSPRWVTLSRAGSWLPTNAELPPDFPRTSLELTSRKETPPNTIRLAFSLKGPVHMGIILCPHENVSLTDWSMNAEILPTSKFKNRPYFFVYVGRGYGTKDNPWTFSIDLIKASGNLGTNKLIDVLVMGHDFEREVKLTSELKLEAWPEWSFPTTWTSTLQTYVF